MRQPGPQAKSPGRSLPAACGGGAGCVATHRHARLSRSVPCPSQAPDSQREGDGPVPSGGDRLPQAPHWEAEEQPVALLVVSECRREALSECGR